MSKDTNKQAAEKLFAETTHDVLFANPKGEFFTSENIGALSLKPGEKLEKFERTPKEESIVEKVYELNAKDTVTKVKEVSSLEELKAFDYDDRKSVKEAVEKKAAELIATIKVVGTSNKAQDGNKETEDQK